MVSDDVEVKVPKKRRQPAIAFDLDDTIVDFLGFLCRLHNHLHDTCINPCDIKCWDFKEMRVEDARGNVVVGSDLEKTFKDFENDGLYSSLPVLPDARNALTLFQKLGYKIIIITARKDSFQKQTLLNLFHQRIPHDEIHFSYDKVKTLRELSSKYNIKGFMDDKASTVEDVFNRCNIEHVFLIAQSHNRESEIEDVVRVNNLFECVRYFKEIK
jgi:5'(3')-deoxyribonucleotidase